MSADQPLLLIFGGGDGADQIRRSGQRITIAGSSDFGKLLTNRDLIHRLLITRNHRPQPTELSGYPVIVNMITEAETSARILGDLKALLRGFAGRAINPPDAVLSSTRDQMARLLSGIPGLVVPKIVRLSGGDALLALRMIESAEIVPLIIVRQVGTHTGRTVGLHCSIDEAVAVLQGGRDYFATQFVDFASPDGLYRKYRVYFIGPHIVLRHMYVSDDWNVHSKDRARFMGPRPDVIAEERAVIQSAEPFGPAVRDVFRAVRDRMPLDFFGMDFGILPDGNVVLFEANATMSFFPLWRDDDPQFEYLTACVPPAQAAFMELVGLGQ
ncbi:MAG: hypothetical protein ABI770_08580 [Sphingomicrobium sp.]